ncbi:MAG TPA: hypothetical protein VKA81_10240 [Verrucomicrobiae bacterium]|nr:hypothetical protein [Verrucomicrobiae bacterium]
MNSFEVYSTGQLDRQRLCRGSTISKTDAQAGFLDLLVSFCPPMLRIVPVIRPTAKNAKYMRAAGSCTWDVNKGGRLKSTCARLCKPINTKSMKIAATNNILINNITFISFLSGAARWLFRGRQPVESILLAILRLSAVRTHQKEGQHRTRSSKSTSLFITFVLASVWCQPGRCANSEFNQFKIQSLSPLLLDRF